MRSIVTDCVAWSVGLSVTLVSSEPCKTAEPIKRSFGLRTQVGPGNQVLDGGPDTPWEGAILRRKGSPTVKYRETVWSSVQKRLNRSRCCLVCGLGCAQGIMSWFLGHIRDHVLDWVQIPHGKGQVGGKGVPIVKYRETLQSPVRKQLNRLWCRLDCGLGLAQESQIRCEPDPPWEGAILGK